MKYFLGIEVITVNSGVCLNQRKYCLELFHEFDMLWCNAVKTPLDVIWLLKKILLFIVLILFVNITEFQKLIGKLIYLIISRPYIAYVVQILS